MIKLRIFKKKLDYPKDSDFNIKLTDCIARVAKGYFKGGEVTLTMPGGINYKFSPSRYGQHTRNTILKAVKRVGFSNKNGYRTMIKVNTHTSIIWVFCQYISDPFNSNYVPFEITNLYIRID